MTIDTNNMIESILESVSRIDYVKSNDIPNIPLYMDQVTTLMNEKLESSKRYDEDKILTKTMINNYAKNNLLPPPVKKKYDKEHVLVLIFIYYFKNILSIKDIETLLKPLTDNYFSKQNDFNLCDIYEEVFQMKQERIDGLKEELLNAYQESQGTFENTCGAEHKFLQMFYFICVLSFDVYVKKQIIEELIDSFPFDELKPQEDKKKK